MILLNEMPFENLFDYRAGVFWYGLTQRNWQSSGKTN